MRKFILILTILQIFGIVAVCAGAQDQSRVDEKPIIESVDITGVDQTRVSRDLLDLMHQMVGRQFNQDDADEIGYRLQKDINERVSAIRQTPGSDSGHIKLVYEFGGAPPPRDLHENVNSRYTVEDVELRGASESSISDQLRDEMHKMIGEKLDQEKAEEIEHRLGRELGRSRIVSKRVARGSDRNHVRVIYEVEKAPLFDFRKSGNYIVGQSKQGLSFGVEVDHEFRHNRVAFGIVNDGDVLLERDEGFQVSFENIKAATEHLGFRIGYFDYHLKWKSQTELAVRSQSEVPEIYRERRGVEPSLTIAPLRSVQVNLGASIEELQIQYPLIHSQNANAGVATITFDNEWRSSSRDHHRLVGNYSVRAATHNLDSDFIYTRHVGDVRYVFSNRHTDFVATGIAGVLTGRAPLFEQFSLGNTSTLRGWNKYDLYPIGGNRMAHGSLEFRLTNIQIYYDAGSVWNQGQQSNVSHAVGFGAHSRERDGKWFFTVGIPIQSGHFQPSSPLFMFGGRF